MSNFFEQELRKLFGDGCIIDSPRFVGRACLGTLDGDLRARAEFVTMGTVDQYEGLRLTVLKRTDGEVDQLTVRICEAIGRENDTTIFHRGTPYIWTYDGKTEWYGYRPTAADYCALQQVARDYLDVFREQIQERERPTPARKSPGRSSSKKARGEAR